MLLACFIAIGWIVAGGKAQQRPPLKYDISMDEEPEFDPREHDWRFQLPSHSG